MIVFLVFIAAVGLGTIWYWVGHKVGYDYGYVKGKQDMLRYMQKEPTNYRAEEFAEVKKTSTEEKYKGNPFKDSKYG